MILSELFLHLEIIELSLSVSLKDTGSWSPQLLLGLEAINASRDFSKSDQERAVLLKGGLGRIEQVFKLNKSNAASANVLSDFFLQKGDAAKVRYNWLLMIYQLDTHLPDFRLGSQNGGKNDTIR